jgi:hypothetical protein
MVSLAVWYAATICILIVCHLTAQIYVRLRFRTRAAALGAERNCPNCQSDDAMSIDGAKSVTCSACHNRSMTFHIVGKS